MSDLKLFRTDEDKPAVELAGASATVEKDLQQLIERNMDTILGVRFLASEYSTGARHRGRIDSIGLDENGSPVIVEYKRTRDENVINQGLFYLDWLLDHRAEFRYLVQGRLGADAADTIDWSNPRLICIAGDFTRYDQYAVHQIDRTIELVRYRRFGDELLALELLTAATGTPGRQPAPGGSNSRRTEAKTVTEYLAQAPEELRKLFDDLDAALTAFGDDVQRRELKHYIAYKRLKNFACIQVHPRSTSLVVSLKVDPAAVTLQEGFTRDISGTGHLGTGDLEVRISSHEDLERALDLFHTSYEAS
ncbi:endonuclease NucS domain-containing protein [Streptomyces sp. NPDC001404]|uniref:endonuclease NucS domain-containing protein n=1 Tax=Streptomyces sp. NPDC001404 TaxID=3364571 RepID=UPI0036CF2694